MEIDGLLELVWVTIDLDASCKIGDEAGKKKTSSACYPPEMVRPLRLPLPPACAESGISQARRELATGGTFDAAHTARLEAEATELKADIAAAVQLDDFATVGKLNEKLKPLRAQLNHTDQIDQVS